VYEGSSKHIAVLGYGHAIALSGNSLALERAFILGRIGKDFTEAFTTYCDDWRDVVSRVMYPIKFILKSLALLISPNCLLPVITGTISLFRRHCTFVSGYI